jgi:dolichyl-phosphate-mannose-protein mannosyltransferase
MSKKTGSASSATQAGSNVVPAELDPVPELKYGKGTQRAYLVTTPSKDLGKLRSLNKCDKLYLLALVLISVYIRLQTLKYPDSVVFDEVHFGGFARKYLSGKFFMDVHPPLAKMLFAGIASLGGFKGDFTFEKIGLEYPAEVPYVWMRLFSAVLGLGTVILFFLTLKASGVRSPVALLSSLLFSWENSYVTISRYILLDAPLIFFIAASAYSFKRFQNEIPMSFQWFKALIATGVALGLAVSSKWVGLFTIAWVGLLNVWDLWFLIGDLSLPVNKIVKQTASRGIILLGVPAALYAFFFSVHFGMLYKEGDGAAFMTSAFRAGLEGNKIPNDILADVGVGSIVTIRHVATQGGYLHSHPALYETGSKQQQITLYPHLDANNDWKIELYNVSTPPTEFEAITDGTKIRLLHTKSSHRLHSHDHKAPVSDNDWQKEVSGYGYEGFGGDANDDFVVEIQKKYSKSGVASERVRSLETVFRLRHAMTGCYLFSHEVKLPKWAFDQQEVTCTGQGVLDKSLWYIEQNENEFLPVDAERVNYRKQSLLEKILESHKKMWKINSGLTASHSYESNPISWPFLTRGINYWGNDHRQIYLFGNVPVWWSVTALIFGFIVYTAVQILRWQLGERIATDSHVYNFNVQTLHYILGWLIHFFPSFLMGRQMFLHHYLPAYYFGILALAHFLDIIVSYIFSRKRVVGYSVIVAFAAVSFAFYFNYAPLIYGNPWTRQQCKDSKLLSSWDFNCYSYHENLEEYFKSVSPSKILEAVETAAL